MYPWIMRDPKGNLSREVAFRRTAGMFSAVLRLASSGRTCYWITFNDSFPTPAGELLGKHAINDSDTTPAWFKPNEGLEAGS